MVVEFLSFEVHEHERDEWLRHEERHWSRFLERQPGFVRKQMWVPTGTGAPSDVPHTTVHAVIWWESLEAWKAIPTEQLEEVARAMGPYERTAVCEAFDVIREC